MSLSGSPVSPVMTARSLLKTLQTEFPVFRDCQPLSIGIDKQLLAQRPDLDRKILRVALGMHTNSLRYLKATAKAATRFDLDGKPADVLTEVHRAHAVETLRERAKNDAERRRLEREAAAAERLRAEKLGQLVARFGRER